MLAPTPACHVLAWDDALHYARQVSWQMNFWTHQTAATFLFRLRFFSEFYLMCLIDILYRVWNSERGNFAQNSIQSYPKYVTPVCGIL